MTESRRKHVVVAGGSSGFGLRLAHAWMRTGATVTIVARDATRLESAKQQLLTANPDRSIHAIVADVTRQADVDRLFEQVDRLDVLVNAFGQSDRGLAVETTTERFEELLQLNFLAVTRCVRGSIELLKESTGSIVNIGSLASKSVAPYLGAYPPGKFALAAYTAQLRLELADHNVHALLVCPGPIQRDDAGTRYNRDFDTLPESARRPGGGVKLKGIDPDWLASRVIAACESRRAELVVPGKSRLLFAIAQLSPSLGDWIVRRMTS